jgi:ferredoxin
VVADPDRCIGCLYCWWVCPSDAIELDGPLNAMQRQVDRYKKDIEAL